MSYEIYTFREELVKLDRHHEDLKKSDQALRQFINSPQFLEDRVKFLDLLGDFQNKVITLVEISQAPMMGLPPPKEETEEVEEEEEKGETFTMPKAVVVAVAILACAVIVYNSIMPPVVLVAAVFSSIGLMFLPQIHSLVTSLLRREEEEEEIPAAKLENWIHENLAKMRDLYTSARFLVKVQNQTKESIPDYGLPGMDEVLYNRHKYFDETLPSDFLSWIGRIIVECDRNVWARKALIITAITQTQMATAKVT